MSYDPDITKQQIFGVLAPFIVTVTGFPQDCVIQGLGNRDAMPLAAPGFVSMTSVRLRRLNYNVDTWDPVDPNVTEISSEQHIKLSIQLDVYGATSQDKAAALTTLLRDDVAVQALKPVCTPLYCEDAIMGPLDDSEQQYEERWVIELYVQYNPVVTPPVQSANVVGPVNAINVDQRYPPA